MNNSNLSLYESGLWINEPPRHLDVADRGLRHFHRHLDRKRPTIHGLETFRHQRKRPTIYFFSASRHPPTKLRLFLIIYIYLLLKFEFILNYYYVFLMNFII